MTLTNIRVFAATDTPESEFMLPRLVRAHRRLLIALSLLLALALGLRSQGLVAQVVSYAPGVEGQVWQQLPTFGRGVDMGNERPVTIGAIPGGPTFSSPPPLDGLADLWPCTTDGFGFPDFCYSSGVIGTGPAEPPDVMQSYGGRFAPCVGNQCYPSGLIGVGSAVTWAVGPCTMQSGANATDCYPSGDPGSGARVGPANGQLAGPLGIAVDNTPNVGTIYVTDHWNHRVQAFLFDGTVVPLANPIGNGASGAGPQQLSFPESIKVDASRQLIVADSGNSRLAIFDPDGNFVDELVIDDPSGGPSAPTGVALTPGATFSGSVNPPGARIVVTDKYNCTVYVFDATSLARVGIAGGAQCTDVGDALTFANVATVEGAAIDPANHIYVADYDRNRVEIFNSTGTLIGAFGDPLDGAVPPFALSGPTDVMVDHKGVYTETDGTGPHSVARVFVVDTLNQRIAVYKVNFDQATPAASFLFELNAAGDLNGFPSNIAEDTSHDPVGKLVTTDSGNARIQRFQVPDLAVVNTVTNPGILTVSFDVVVPAGKDPVGVTTVTPIVCPTSADTTVTSGIPAPQPDCAGARSLTATSRILPGQKITYSFQYVSGVSTATFDIFAIGNPLNNVPQTTSNHVTARATNTCATCAMTARVILPVGAPEALVAPLPPSTLYVGARTYTTQLLLRLTATSSIGLAQISYQFAAGPETANNAQPGLHTVTVSGTSASVDVPFRLPGTSIVEYWAKNVDGTEIAHSRAQLSLALVPPSLTFRFDLATSTNATRANAAGWWNAPVALPMDFTGHITAVTPLVAGMAANPPLSSPLRFTTEGRNLGFRVTVADNFGLTTTEDSNLPSTEGVGFNIDMTAPTFVTGASLTLQRASYLGAPPPAGVAASMLALATDPNLTTGSAGSGVAGVVPSAVVNFPFGTTTQPLIASDVAGNTRAGNVTVRVLDTIRPVLTGPAAVTVSPGALGNIFATLPGFAVSDASQIGAPAGVTPVVVTQSVSAAQILAVNSVTPVTLTATDPSGNTATLVVTVTAKLLAPPHFTRLPPNQTVEGGSAIDLLATAVDAVGGSLTVTSNAPAKFLLGPTTVTFTAKDAGNQTITGTVVITVVDTKAPVISGCAAPATVFVVPGVAAAYPALSGGVIATDYTTFTVSQTPAAGTSYTLPVGQTTASFTVTLKATDAANNASTCTTTVTFSASSTPVCTAASGGGDLWPPNHKLKTIGISGITNADGKPVTTKVTSIFQDEPTQGLGDGDTPIDGYITNGVAQVRAERSGLGNGRVYYLNFTATSSSGSACTGTVWVGVPHDQAHPTVGDGPLYDSTKITSAANDGCHGTTSHGHHDGDGCLTGHHGHYDGDECHATDGYHHDGDGHGGGNDRGTHRS
jgi:hypothetical protein